MTTATEEEVKLTSAPLVSLSADKVARATKHMPQEEGDAIRWYFAFTRIEGLTNEQAAARIELHQSNLNRLFNGKYSGDVSKYVEAIQAIRRRTEAERKVASTEFVETSIARKIFQVCDFALSTNTVANIYGDGQVGKTFALEEFARRRNHGTTRYFRFPGGGGGVQLMMREIATACGNSRTPNFETLRRGILDVLGPDNLLIADEVHQAFQSYQKYARFSCIEVLREIHDRTKCGLIICATNVLRDEIEKGKFKQMLKQIHRRGVVELQLPAVLPVADVHKLAASYGLPAPTGEAAELVTDIIKKHGPGKFCIFLKSARRLAENRGAALAWKHFVSAHDILKNLSVEEEN